MQIRLISRILQVYIAHFILETGKIKITVNIWEMKIKVSPQRAYILEKE